MISDRSRKALTGVHPDLIRVIERADAMGAKFTVVCGLRTKQQQEELVAQGKSKTMKSRHLTGHAVDLADEHFTWHEHEMNALSKVVKRAASDVGVPVEWGGDWKGGWDTPHFQLPAGQYPDDEVFEAAPILNDLVNNSPPPVKPLVKSRTIWTLGSATSLLTWLASYVDTGLHVATEAASKFSQTAGIRDTLGMVGGNGKHIAITIGIGCLVSAISLVVGDKTPKPAPAPEAEQ